MYKIVKPEKLIIYLLIVANLLFLIYFAILSFYSRPHFDDLNFMWMLRDMSIIDYVRDMYFERSGRIWGYGINGIVFSIVNGIGEHRFFPFIFYLIGFSFVWLSLQRFSKHKSTLFLASSLFAYNLSYLTNTDFAVFGWLCAMSYYWLAPLLLYLTSILIKTKGSKSDWFIVTWSDALTGAIR